MQSPTYIYIYERYRPLDSVQTDKHKMSNFNCTVYRFALSPEVLLCRIRL